jgi:hypothetical protein
MEAGKSLFNTKFIGTNEEESQMCQKKKKKWSVAKLVAHKLAGNKNIGGFIP